MMMYCRFEVSDTAGLYIVVVVVVETKGCMGAFDTQQNFPIGSYVDLARSPNPQTGLRFLLMTCA